MTYANLLHDWIIRMKISAKKLKKEKKNFMVSQITVNLAVCSAAYRIDISKYFYLPDLINLTFFKTDYIEV